MRPCASPPLSLPHRAAVVVNIDCKRLERVLLEIARRCGFEDKLRERWRELSP
jgi:hypothetical protein